ncbi:beta-N-acetylglucosaminidase [Salsuginibacillus halophilus]|uniref:Beta-N-acetylglucosaminidase n=1 Tax=Salsuginibacillus halophilus TaxID=517424 RepID=A0A2P8HQE7_9BACI|nr:glucosaminidase domain-containing protein [Salsuginibacillus halophilus]PSL48437.1 beta-N-acetylglucosaminidase [Salsuginibacillus halophilus]
MRLLTGVTLICGGLILPTAAAAFEAPESDIDIDHTWTITWNEAVDVDTAEAAIQIIDEDDSAHDISVQPVDGTPEAVQVIPLTDYEPNRTYTLTVDETAASADGTAMDETITHPFETETVTWETADHVDGDWVRTDSFETWEAAREQVDEHDAILQDEEVVWAHEGTAVTGAAVTNIYPTKNLASGGGAITYVAGHTTMELLSAGEDWVEVEISGAHGYTPAAAVELRPEVTKPNRSYYKNNNGELYHYIHRAAGYDGAYHYGPAPDFLDEGERAYSTDGINFGEDMYEHPYTFKDITEPTDLDEDDFDDIFAEHRPDAPLREGIEYFFKAEDKHDTNAFYLLTHAIHESSWGESMIAEEKNNFFGINAVDSNPFENATTYESMKDGVIEGAAFISNGYLDENDWRYEGPFPGFKGAGMNVRYASDPYWGQKMAGFMYRLSEAVDDDE